MTFIESAATIINDDASPEQAAENNNRPSKQEAMKAVRTLIEWAGDNPEREGLLETPKRVAEAYDEFFAGYDEDPEAILAKTFEQVDGYDEMVLLKNMEFESHCEHHMVPIIGKAHIAYLPSDRVVGISKLARLLDVYCKRLQTQETMTAQIADTIAKVLRPRGVAILVDAKHMCMTTRGVHKTSTTTVTTRLLGEFKENDATRRQFFDIINNDAIG